VSALKFYDLLEASGLEGYRLAAFIVGGRGLELGWCVERNSRTIRSVVFMDQSSCVQLWQLLNLCK
jgi:hypothetical protein